MDVIGIENLCKSYRSREVLHDLSVGIAEGKLVGFLGPNGAGKTTTIRVLLGLLRATSGRTRILGKDCWSDGPSIRAEVGYLPGELRFYPGLIGRRTLEFLAGARRLDCGAEVARLQSRFDLDLDARVRNYSSGMRQKLGLIQALMHRPRLLILDEPTSGLDPLIRRELYDELRGVVARGRTVLFSSHTLGEVDELCDEVIVLRDGRLVEHEGVEALRGRAPRAVEIVLRDEPSARLDLPTNLLGVVRTGARIAGRWSGPIGPLLDWLAACPSLRDVIIAPPDLESLFLDYYSGGDRPT